ncbi:MAG TPA: hypothetical protein V6D48_15255 [Oculatellaceae cyanobacterium]
MADPNENPNEKDFPAPTQYQQTYTRNESWANVTTTRIESDGTKVQSFYIQPSRQNRAKA